MTVSLPSKEIYAVDVPEVESINGTFHYNFFVKDESVNGNVTLPKKISERKPTEIDAKTLQYADTRVPRYVTLNWKLSQLSDPSGFESDSKQRMHNFFANSQNGSLIADNIDKVITEDHFSANNFVGVTFHDGMIDQKIHYMLSSSYVLMTDGDPKNGTSSNARAAALSSALPDEVDVRFVTSGLADSTGINFVNDGHLVVEEYFQSLKSAATNAQVNARLFHNIVNQTLTDTGSPYSTELKDLFYATKKMSAIAPSSGISEKDYKPIVPEIGRAHV